MSKKNINILIISIGYVFHDTPSDKQFVHDLITGLPSNISIAIFTLNDDEEKNTTYKIGDKEIHYISRNRLLHRPIFFSGENYKPHPNHSMIRNGIEISISILYYLRYMRRLIDEFKPDLFHFTDSIGPAIILMKKLFPSIPITITKPTMQINREHLFWLYKYYVKKSIESANEIITFTHASKNEMQKLGIDTNKVSVIPWGVLLSDLSSNKENRGKIRERYNVRPDELLIVVSDRSVIQGFSEMLETLKFLVSLYKVKFVVTIRPTRFKSEYYKLSTDNIIFENGPKDFYYLLEEADALFSPPNDGDISLSTSLLPLAWIHAMYRKTPVITRYIPGIEDLIENKKSGYLYQSTDELLNIFDKLMNEKYREIIQDNAKYLVVEKFSFDAIIQRYCKIWDAIKLP